jgi:hypothetical protein
MAGIPVLLYLFTFWCLLVFALSFLMILTVTIKKRRKKLLLVDVMIMWLIEVGATLMCFYAWHRLTTFTRAYTHSLTRGPDLTSEDIRFMIMWCTVTLIGAFVLLVLHVLYQRVRNKEASV